MLTVISLDLKMFADLYKISREIVQESKCDSKKNLAPLCIFRTQCASCTYCVISNMYLNLSHFSFRIGGAGFKYHESHYKSGSFDNLKNYICVICKSLKFLIMF